MECDVILNGRVNSSVSVVAYPPLKEAEVFFPIESDLPKEDQAVIETAMLAYYYDVAIEDYRFV